MQGDHIIVLTMQIGKFHFLPHDQNLLSLLNIKVRYITRSLCPLLTLCPFTTPLETIQVLLSYFQQPALTMSIRCMVTSLHTP